MIINRLIKKNFYVFLILLVISCSSDTKENCSNLSEENGLVYIQGKPFTGSCLTYFDENPESIKEIRSFRKGLMHGNWIQYHDNGNIFYDSYAKKGEIHGKYSSFHYNGNLADKGKMKKGYKDGVWEYYGINGVLYRKELFKNKILIDYKDY
tara:strand:+ start:283 stop:738 length:456 start_codon:yes stop_codon:yes gene_type:complete